MQFDALVAIVERHLPQYAPVVRAAKIFDFPVRYHEISDRLDNVDEAYLDFLYETFFLPFRVVAVEDTASCVILWDIEKDAQGFASKRGFLECMVYDNDTHKQLDPSTAGAELNALQAIPEAVRQRLGVRDKDKVAQIAVGTFDMHEPQFVDGEAKYVIHGGLECGCLATKGVVIIAPERFRLDDQLGDGLLKSSLRSVQVAVSELAYINSPDRWVVQVRHNKQRSARKGTIARSDQRDHYELRTTLDLRKMFQREKSESGAERASTRPHMRRRHFRVLDPEKTPRYKEKKILTIAASWVGQDTEATIGNKTYSVRLDL